MLWKLSGLLRKRHTHVQRRNLKNQLLSVMMLIWSPLKLYILKALDHHSNRKWFRNHIFLMRRRYGSLDVNKSSCFVSLVWKWAPTPDTNCVMNAVCSVTLPVLFSPRMNLRFRFCHACLLVLYWHHKTTRGLFITREEWNSVLMLCKSIFTEIVALNWCKNGFTHIWPMTILRTDWYWDAWQI